MARGLQEPGAAGPVGLARGARMGRRRVLFVTPPGSSHGPGEFGIYSRVTGMLRQVGCAVFALLLLGGALRAEDFKGKVTRVEPQQMLLSVSVNGQERTYKVANGAKFVDEV